MLNVLLLTIFYLKIKPTHNRAGLHEQWYWLNYTMVKYLRLTHLHVKNIVPNYLG